MIEQLNSNLLAITYVPAIGKIQEVARTTVANVKLLILSELRASLCTSMMQDCLCSNSYVCKYLEAHHPKQGNVAQKGFSKIINLKIC